MSVGIDQFEAFFRAVYNHDPFPWQSRLARIVFNVGWPTCIDLPTASGKTATIDIAVFVLAAQAERKDHQRTVGRRIFFTVNRRVIVDEAFKRAYDIAVKLLEANSGILKEVADGLRSINADTGAPPLDVSELRGGIYRDRRWARSLTQPIVVATTADQLGSRLLFRGYGVSAISRPIHAALVACDSTILLDEAHCTRAFSQSLAAIQEYRSREVEIPPMHYVQMTATPTGEIKDDQRFQLDDDDLQNAILKKRQNASKAAQLRSSKKKDKAFAHEIAELAIKGLDETHRAIGVIVNRVQTARDVYARLRELQPDVACHLVIGRMRPIDRDKLTEDLRTIVGPKRPDTLLQPCFVVATQCLEVGADYDFDTLITECASIDALRQRFGRLNRTGRDGAFIASAIIIAGDSATKPDDPVYGDSMEKTWKWLNEVASQGVVDFGISAFKPRWESLDEKTKHELSAPAAEAAVLLPAHLDALCQTAPEPEPSPDVAYFIHGPQRTNLEVQVCWRADLLEGEEKLWPEIVGLIPPTSAECMTVPLRDLRNWMSADSVSPVEADVPVRDDPDERYKETKHSVLVWRGVSDSGPPVSDANRIRPGDTIVIPTRSGGWEVLGHIPNAPIDPKHHAIVDVAECAARTARRQIVLRIRPDTWHDRVSGELRDYAMSSEKTLRRSEVRRLLRDQFDEAELPSVIIASAFDEFSYPVLNGDEQGTVIRFRMLLDDPHKLPEIVSPEDDADEPLLKVAAKVPTSLKDHTDHVVAKIEGCLEKLSLSSLGPTFRRAAELHDIGKCDPRFQALLLGVSPAESMFRPMLLAKSGNEALTKAQRTQQRKRSCLPEHFRHEMLSVELLHNTVIPLDESLDRTLLLHVIAAHHGYARPFAPVAIDPESFDLDISKLLNVTVGATERLKWRPAHRIDSGIAESFWSLTHRFGWWGLVYFEAVLRLADQQASDDESNSSNLEKKL